MSSHLVSSRLAIVGVSTCLVLGPAVAQGQGFGVYEQGACAMSRGGAAVAAPCQDGSAIYTNPAGVAGAKGILVSGGSTLIFAAGSFTSDAGARTKLDSGVAAAPHGYFQYGISDRVGVGVGVYAPYGLSVKWPLDFAGRFVSYDSGLHTIYVQPTVAYAVNRLVSVGGGLTVATGSVRLRRREDLATVPLGAAAPGLTFGALVEPETDFADTSLTSSRATGVGVNVGVLMKPHERIHVGARYLSRVTLSYSGRATFAPVPGPFAVTRPNVLGLPVGTPLDASVSQVVGALPAQSVRTEIRMPAQFVAGASVRAAPKVMLVADYQWVDWSSFDTVVLDFDGPIPPDERLVQNYRDTSAARVGLEFDAGRAATVRAGYFFNQAAAPDESVTPLLPEARRNHVTAGVGWRLNRSVSLDLAYQFIHHADRRGRIVNPAPGDTPTVALNTGTYRARSDLVGITLTYRR